MRAGHRGNKAGLPSKTCRVCGRPMSWRRAWAANWEQVRYCSEACRRRKGAARGGGRGGGAGDAG
ncbi:MAG: DUF2256 domain-containing protein [Xanthomonadaceae bacterium]|nr:DUF2256 domain-containing protein [Xanthomonadaceae bacterium]